MPTCRGNTCLQGRRACMSPLTCSGFDVDGAIASLRLPPVPLDEPDDVDKFPGCENVLSTLFWFAASLAAAVATLVSLAFVLGYAGRALGLF